MGEIFVLMLVLCDQKTVCFEAKEGLLFILYYLVSTGNGMVVKTHVTVMYISISV